MSDITIIASVTLLLTIYNTYKMHRVEVATNDTKNTLFHLAGLEAFARGVKQGIIEEKVRQQHPHE